MSKEKTCIKCKNCSVGIYENDSWCNIHSCYVGVDDICNKYRVRIRKIWTDKEIEYLEFEYATSKIKELSKVLGRNEGAIYAKARKLGLTKNWSKEEDEYLINNYKDTPFHILEDKLDRNKGTIISRASFLGVYKRNLKRLG